MDDTKHAHWEEWRGIVKQSQNLKLRHIEHKYFFNCITECRKVDVVNFLVDETEKKIESKKRQLEPSPSMDNLKRVRQEPELVTLDDSDDDDIQILEQKLINRKHETTSRIYIEKSSNLNTSCEVIDLGDTDEENVEDVRENHNNNVGLSFGLQQAISKLQQKPRPLNRKSKSFEKKIQFPDNSNSSKDDDDDIEVLVQTKTPQDNGLSSRKAGVLDRKSVMFQTGLKNLLNQDLEADDKSQSSVEEESRPHTEETEEVEAAPVTAVEVASPSQPFPALSMDSWGEAEGPVRRLCLVLDCVLDRQSVTSECLTVGLGTSRTNKYLKSSGGRGGAVPRQVDSSVREEVQHKYRDPRGEDDRSLTSHMNEVSNVLSSLKFLQSYTSQLVQPTPAIINNLLTTCLLGQQNRLLVEKTVDYLEVAVYRFLSCVATKVMTYIAWQEVILSALRTGNNLQLNSFNINDKRDTAGCRAFFKLLIKEFASDQPGPGLLAEFLVGLCQRDLQLWWRHHKTDGWPVLYYLLGDSDSGLVSTVRSVLAPAYSSLLLAPYSEKLGVVRRLLTMAGIILSHQDNLNRQSYINTGHKMELAKEVAGVLAQWYSQAGDSQALWSELVLLQPDWLSLLVSRHLLARLTSVKMSSLSSLADITAAMARLTVEERGGGVGRCGDVILYRAVTSCHLHTLLRTVWADSDTSSVFNMMSRLDRTQEKTYNDKAKTKTVKFRSGVTFKMSSILEDINLLAGYVNGRLTVECQESQMSSLMFKMTDVTHF